MAPATAGAIEILRLNGLLEAVIDVVEGVLQARADTLHDENDGDRDAGGDKAIFDGGRAGLVLHETRNEGLHGSTP